VFNFTVSLTDIGHLCPYSYYPAVLILKPGQHIHINKGRLHAFRKLQVTPLPESDCHAEHRRRLVADEGLTSDPVCMSVAWDWLFLATSANGTNREAAACLECASLNRANQVKSLAIPETALLNEAATLRFPDERDSSSTRFVPDPVDVCRGILPSVRHIVSKSLDALKAAKAKETNKEQIYERCKKVSFTSEPDASESPEETTIDPYGSDYFCRLCDCELSNVYMHCEGCELLLLKDFNICVDCHSEQMFAKNIQMHPTTNKRKSTLNHTGVMRGNNHKRCPCKNGPACDLCSFCSGCSCRCHTYFIARRRFCEEAELISILQRLEEAQRDCGIGPVEYAKETELRLRLGGKPVEKGKAWPNVSIQKGQNAVGSSSTRRHTSSRKEGKSRGSRGNAPVCETGEAHAIVSAAAGKPPSRRSARTTTVPAQPKPSGTQVSAVSCVEEGRDSSLPMRLPLR